MKRKKKILTYIVISLVTIFFILPSIGFGIIKWSILPPKKLTPLVIEQTNKFINAHLDCERIELTYFETYPYLGIKLTNGRLISHIADDSLQMKQKLTIPADSLLSFKSLIIAIQPLNYIFGNKITIKDFALEQPRIYGYVNKEGINNWTIYDSSTDSTEENSSKKPLPIIDLQKIRIKDGHFTFDDRQNDIYTEINGFYFNVDGSLTKEHNTLSLETGSTSTLFKSQAYSLDNNLNIQLKSQIKMDNHYESIELEKAEMKINDLPFTAHGFIKNHPALQTTRIDLDMGLKIDELKDILQFIPSEYLKDKDKAIAKGRVILEGGIHGILDENHFPSVNLCCKIEDGSYHQEGIKHGIDEIQMDMDLHLNGEHPDSSFFSLEELKLKGLNTALDMKGKITQLMTDPQINTCIKGSMDFTAFGKEFLNPDTLLVEGKLTADIDADFKVNDLIESRFGHIQAKGGLHVDRLTMKSIPLDMDILLKNTHLSIDSTRYVNKYIDKKDLMGITFISDTLNLKYKDEIYTKVNKLRLQAKTSPVIDTSAVVPMTADIDFAHLSTLMTDSVWLIAGKTELKAAVKPSSSNKHIPVTGAIISMDTLIYYSTGMKSGILMHDNVIKMEALPYSDARKQRMLARIASGDTTTRKRNQSKRTYATPDSTDSSKQLLNDWEVRGSVAFENMNIFSAYFPIKTKMDKTTLKFTTSNITLSNARLHIGESDLLLNGELKRIRQAFLHGGKINGTFTLNSDLIDCNELMQAINQGMMLSDAENHSSDVKALSLNELSSAQIDTESNIEAADTSAQLFVLPPFLDLSLVMNAKKINFKDLQLSNVEGEVVMRDQSLNLNKLSMHSNMGDGELTMNYTAKNKDEASTGFDLDIEKMNVEGIINLFPAIDTLIPMLRSFEGVLDCQMVATCKLDSAMNLVLPSVNAACYMRGKDMVLLDGETFTEISKTLMFKNKKKNAIDSIAVDFAIKDNKIEVFPFQIDMDRYKVAVGGTHNLDMTFNYHISVLKSPVPFKLGIDITGNLDDFKYKITKCKYKDLFKPAKMEEMSIQRKNIRQDIRNAVLKQIHKSAPELSLLSKTETSTLASE